MHTKCRVEICISNRRPVTSSRQIRRVQKLWCLEVILLELDVICARPLGRVKVVVKGCDGGIIGEFAHRNWLAKTE